MTNHSLFSIRSLGAALVGVLFVGAIGFGAPAAAQEKAPEKKQFRIIERGDGKGEKRREFRIIERDGAGGDGEVLIIDRDKRAEFPAKCENVNKAESNVEGGAGDKKFFTRIFVCGDKGESAAEVRGELIKALEKARAELGDDVSGEHRAQVIAALDREIARVRAQTN